MIAHLSTPAGGARYGSGRACFEPAPSFIYKCRNSNSSSSNANIRFFIASNCMSRCSMHSLQ
eukprot:scaffold314342_cov19-Prasinocladus_malaysianus.AAC.1